MTMTLTSARRLGCLLALAFAAAPGIAGGQSGSDSTWQEVGRILQTTDVFAGGYHRYTLPRRDLTLKIGDVTVAPALALGAWAGFSGDPVDVTLMGDLVLISSELKAVQAELARQHLSVTAVHNHLAGEEPRLTYVHYHGEGNAIDLAKRLDRVLALTATPRPVAAAQPRPPVIDTAMVFRTLGQPGRAQGDVAQLTFILVPGTVTMHGRTVNPGQGYGTPINIQLVSPTRAVATGDFTIIGAKVDPVLTALATHGITATALHSHLIDESPRLYYIHFWADAPLPDVLAGLKAALDAAR